MSETLLGEVDHYHAPGIDEAILELTEKYGVEPHEAEQGIALAVSMQDTLTGYAGALNVRGRHAIEKHVKILYAEAAVAIPEIPVDNHGRPLPRYRYIASDILGATLDPSTPFYGYFNGVANAPMIPNFARTKEVVDTLVPLLLNNQHPYDQPEFILPENPLHMPKTPFEDARQEANFYLTACLWMRRTDSNKAMTDLGRMFDNTRSNKIDPFDPNGAQELGVHAITGIVSRYPQLRMIDTNAPGLIHNMQFLDARFGGDIRNAYADTDDFDEIVLRLKNSPHQADPSKYDQAFGKGLYGFQEKMISMLTYYLIEADILPPFDYPPPIDQHLARLGAGTGSIRIVGEFKDKNIMNETLLGVGRDLYYDLSLKHGINPNHIAQALWLMGSKNCSMSPETFANVISKDGRSSVIEAYEPKYHKSGFDTIAYYRTCGGCPLNTANNPLCTHTSQGKRNHLLGSLELQNRADLPKPAEHTVFGDDEEWEKVTAQTAAEGRAIAGLRRITVHRPAYEQARNSDVQAPRTSPTNQNRLF